MNKDCPVGYWNDKILNNCVLFCGCDIYLCKYYKPAQEKKKLQEMLDKVIYDDRGVYEISRSSLKELLQEIINRLGVYK